MKMKLAFLEQGISSVNDEIQNAHAGNESPAWDALHLGEECLKLAILLPSESETQSLAIEAGEQLAELARKLGWRYPDGLPGEDRK